MGGDDFIQKPFYTDVLVAKINALLRRTYSYMETAANVMAHNGVVLNLKDGDVACGDQKAELTRNEFKILTILLQNQGAIVSREQMMRGLWEDESFVDDNTLTVNITRLRKKLAELGRDDFITTKKGQGYMIP
ncbi:Response regulator protein GraR [compost metagenome]